MFDDILQMVREHIGNNPAIASAIPADQADAVHTEIANHVNNAVQNPQSMPVDSGSILSGIENSLRAGSLTSTAITGGLVNSLASRFGLSPAISGAIAASIPRLLQEYLNKKNTGTSTTAP